VGRLWRGVAVVLVLVLGGAAPVVAQSWYDQDGYGGPSRYAPYGVRRAVAYDDGYIRSGRDWPRPAYHRARRYDGDEAYGRYAAPGYRCTVRHVYYDPDFDRYTVVHRPVPCRGDYRY